MNRIFIKFMHLIVFSAVATAFITSPARGTVIYIPGVKAKPGQTVDIPVMVDHVDNLAGIKVVMKYDAEYLIFKKASKTGNTSSLMHIVNSKKPGTLVVVMAGARGIKGKDIPIISLVFELKKELKNKQNIKIDITETELMSDKLKYIKCDIKVNPIIVSAESQFGKDAKKAGKRPEKTDKCTLNQLFSNQPE